MNFIHQQGAVKSVASQNILQGTGAGFYTLEKSKLIIKIFKTCAKVLTSFVRGNVKNKVELLKYLDKIPIIPNLPDEEIGNEQKEKEFAKMLHSDILLFNEIFKANHKLGNLNSHVLYTLNNIVYSKQTN